MYDPKSILKSRTFWVNVVAIAFYVLAKFGLTDGAVSPEVAGYIDALYAVALPILNIILRRITAEPVAFKL